MEISSSINLCSLEPTALGCRGKSRVCPVGQRDSIWSQPRPRPRLCAARAWQSASDPLGIGHNGGEDAIDLHSRRHDPMKNYGAYSFWLETCGDDLTPRPPLD